MPVFSKVLSICITTVFLHNKKCNYKSEISRRVKCFFCICNAIKINLLKIPSTVQVVVSSGVALSVNSGDCRFEFLGNRF